MKKNNYVVMALAVVAGIFLLFLWYYLGFNKVDNPLDLVISILWWIADALIIAGIIRAENKRQEQIRTIYVSPAALFNSERGVVAVPDAADRMNVMESILQALEYDFSNEDMPEKEDFEYKYVVQTETYKPAEKAEDKAEEESADQQEQEQPDWKGKVTRIDPENGNEETEFSTPDELAALLAA
ncbi:hypothetical protein [Paratractidigestivibacter sp.]|uniref:hypothetical protein n=1 Tax=Paratractidigestivibacter sp. TaxID=2847316 RepID=UPI002AC8F056|nr:hypothetical protein [Paratractidigestivibacter sp.]